MLIPTEKKSPESFLNQRKWLRISFTQTEGVPENAPRKDEWKFLFTE